MSTQIKKIGLHVDEDGMFVNILDYNKGWNKLKIDDKYKNKENFEMFCYLNYLGIDAEQVFYNEIKNFKNNLNKNNHEQKRTRKTIVKCSCR